MRVIHFHFGPDNEAEPFFARFVNALAERGFEQQACIQLDRPWRKALHPLIAVTERQIEPRSIDRFWMPMRIKRRVRQWRPDALVAWNPASAALLPDMREPIRVVRLDTAPETLKGFDNIDIAVCSTPGIAGALRKLGWDRPAEIIPEFTTEAPQTPDTDGGEAEIVNAFIEVLMEPR